MRNIRSKLVTGAAVAAAAVGGASIASAATSGSTSSPAGSSAPPAAQHGPFDPSKGGHTSNGRTETLLTGDVAASVRKAALAKVSGTVERVETNVDDSAPYEAHIRKADGTEVTVEVDKDLSVASVQTMGAHP
jgi:Tfp pilus assembly protein PilV